MIHYTLYGKFYFIHLVFFFFIQDKHFNLKTNKLLSLYEK